MGHASLQCKTVLSASDIAATARLARQIWEQHYTPIIGTEQVNYMLTKFQSEAAIAQQIEEGYEYTLWQTDKPVGYLCIQERENHLFISKIYVTHPERGKGYGKEMMNYAMAIAADKALQIIRLTVNKHNDKSIAAYQKMSFTIRRAVVFDIGQGYVMDDYEMELEV